MRSEKKRPNEPLGCNRSVMELYRRNDLLSTSRRAFSACTNAVRWQLGHLFALLNHVLTHAEWKLWPHCTIVRTLWPTSMLSRQMEHMLSASTLRVFGAALAIWASLSAPALARSRSLCTEDVVVDDARSGGSLMSSWPLLCEGYSPNDRWRRTALAVMTSTSRMMTPHRARNATHHVGMLC